MGTVIPGDAKDKAKFLYHPTLPGSKRVDLNDKDIAEAELRRLYAEGWTERRFAQMLYHARLGHKVFTSAQAVRTALDKGWSEAPLPAEEGSHPDSVHPHESDDHRMIHLADQERYEDPDEEEGFHYETESDPQPAPKPTPKPKATPKAKPQTPAA